MTVQETNKILALMVEAYPKFNEGRNPVMTSKLWSTIFQDEPYEWVEKAFMAFVATDTKGFPPSPGALKEKIQQLTGTEEPTEIEAWGMVLKAISNGLYGAKEEFAKLPREIQEIIGSADQIREWAGCYEDEVNTVIASNFQRSYRARAESRKMEMRLPDSLKIGKVECPPLPDGDLESIGDITKRLLGGV